MPYKDPDKKRECDRRSRIKHKAKRQAYYKAYLSVPENYEKKKKRTLAYEKRPEVIAAKKIRNQELYQANKEKVKTRQAKRRRERLDFMNAIALHYGCQNPNCQWQTELQTYQMDFHHLNPNDKVIEIAKMESWSYPKIVEEINKCIVLCKNCHASVHHGKLLVDTSMLCQVSNDLKVIGK